MTPLAIVFFALVGLAAGWLVVRCIAIMRLHDRIKTCGF
jgi:hypothetical protein